MQQSGCSHWTALFWTYGIKTNFIKVSTKSSQLNAVFRSLNYSDFIDWISVEISSVALHPPDNNRSARYQDIRGQKKAMEWT